VVYVGTGSAALNMVRSKHFAAVLLDLGLPDMPGQAVISELRKRGSKLPIVVVSADVESEAAASALRAGADVVLGTPVSVGVLQAQLQALLRRHTVAPLDVAQTDEVELDGIRFNRRRCSLSMGSRELLLRPREFQLALILAQRKGKIIDRDELIRLLDHTGRRENRPKLQTITVHLKRVRDKALDTFGKPLIHTARSEGDYFDGEHTR